MEKKTYANNGKISSRQTLRLYVFDLMGIATLLIPPYLAKLCGANGIYAILLGICCGVLYLLYLGWIMKQMGSDIVTYLIEQKEVLGSKIFFGMTFLHSILTAGFCAYVFANLMQYSLVKETSYVTILLLILLTATYAVSGGIEGRARIYEVLFYFILVPYIVMMLASIRDFEWDYLRPVLEWNSANLGKGTHLVFLFFTPLFFSLFLIGEKEKNYGRNVIKTILVSVLLSGGILMGSYIVLMGNFGTRSLETLRFPVITLMSTVQFEGNFLKRMDALMLAVWFFTLYALLNLHLHYGVLMCTKLCKKSTWKQKVFPGIAVFLVSLGFYLKENLKELFFAYYGYGAVLFMLLSPLLVLGIGKGKEKQNAISGEKK